MIYSMTSGGAATRLTGIKTAEMARQAPWAPSCARGHACLSLSHLARGPASDAYDQGRGGVSQNVHPRHMNQPWPNLINQVVAGV